MLLKSATTAVILAALFCPGAPAKFKDQPTKAVSLSVTVVKASNVQADFTRPGDDQYAEPGDLTGADAVPAVWYHTNDEPIIESDVVFHHGVRKTHSKAKQQRAFERNETLD